MSKIAKTKRELIAQIAEQSGYTHTATRQIFDTIFAVIANELAKDCDVRIKHFGTFKAKQNQARTARNPKTGERVQVPAKTVVKFYMGQTLKASVNQSK